MQAVVFDLDGVLTDTADYHFKAWKNLAASIGIQIDHTFNEQLKGISRMDSLERILEYGGRSNDFTLIEREQLAEQKNEEYRLLIASITPRELLPGIASFLRELKDEGLKIGLASASKNGSSILERLHIADNFDTIVDPAKLSKGKPDPEIFRTAADQLNLLPSECAGIEDAVAGIQSINGAGIFSVGVGVPPEAKADWNVNATAELTLGELMAHFKAKK
ncbi:beta-phosphoglucomutase [Sporolactobacillus nakayamae]|uniref:Beta-phosphoglucomutase n=1 Tax=Sporolactobacillus nakayamae TaxID=269670 RepID=A0A1I2TW67_9BACL|nr:beta-phosphoglucomutase [Sporolactobacillus nakayamae]SFG67637.1 beta-phosphoglucomutase [Sporolactobacillus nakayamae]